MTAKKSMPTALIPNMLGAQVTGLDASTYVASFDPAALNNKRLSSAAETAESSALATRACAPFGVKADWISQPASTAKIRRFTRASQALALSPLSGRPSGVSAIRASFGITSSTLSPSSTRTNRGATRSSQSAVRSMVDAHFSHTVLPPGQLRTTPLCANQCKSWSRSRFQLGAENLPLV